MLLLSNDGMDNFIPFYIFFSFLLIFSAGMDHCSDKPVSREPGDVHGIVFQVDQLHFYSSKNINGSEWLVKSAEYCCRKCFFLEHHGDCAECVRPARHPMGDGGRPNFSFTFFLLGCIILSVCLTPHVLFFLGGPHLRPALPKCSHQRPTRWESGPLWNKSIRLWYKICWVKLPKKTISIFTPPS